MNKYYDMNKYNMNIRRNKDKVSGFPDIVLGDIYYKYNQLKFI